MIIIINKGHGFRSKFRRCAADKQARSPLVLAPLPKNSRYLRGWVVRCMYMHVLYMYERHSIIIYIYTWSELRGFCLNHSSAIVCHSVSWNLPLVISSHMACFCRRVSYTGHTQLSGFRAQRNDTSYIHPKSTLDIINYVFKILSVSAINTALLIAYCLATKTHILLQFVDYELSHLSPLTSTSPGPPRLEPVIKLNSRGMLLEGHDCMDGWH